MAVDRDTAGAVLFCNPQHVLRHLRKIRILKQEIPQRVSAMGIEAGGNNHEIGFESTLDVS